MYEIKYKQVEKEDLKADTAEVLHRARKKQTGQETALGATLREDDIEQDQQSKRPEEGGTTEPGRSGVVEEEGGDHGKENHSLYQG